MEDIDTRYDRQIDDLEYQISNAVRQVTELKLNKYRAIHGDIPNDDDENADGGGDSGRRISRGSNAEDFAAYERLEHRKGLIAVGNISPSALAPLPPKALYNAALGVGMPAYQAACLVITHNNAFNNFISLTICVASLAVGLETDHPEWGSWLGPINLACLFVFTAELVAKIVGLRRFFWFDPEGAIWNRFDFFIVGLSLIDLIVGLAGAGFRSGGVVVVLRVLRLLRVLRSLRTLKTSAGLMVLMESIAEALVPTTSVLIIIAILFYIFAILFTELVGKAPHFEGDEYIHIHFGTVGNSLGTLLQILTLDSWSATARYVQHNSENMEYILMLWALYIGFILLAPLMMLNCLNAIFVEGVITKITHKKLEKVKADINKKQDVARRLKKIFTELDTSGDGFVTEIEIKEAMENSAVLAEVKRLGLRMHHLEAMFLTADDNGDGKIDCLEFLRGFSDLLNIPLSRKDIVKMAAESAKSANAEPHRVMSWRVSRIEAKIDSLMEKFSVKAPEGWDVEPNSPETSPGRRSLKM